MTTNTILTMTCKLIHLAGVTVLLMVSTALYAGASSCPVKPYELSTPAGYDHTRYAPMPLERRYDGGSFVASVDGPDDDNGDGSGEYLVQPNWVASHIRAAPSDRPGNFTLPLSAHDIGIDSRYSIRNGQCIAPIKQ